METVDFLLQMFQQFFTGFLRVILGPIEGIVQILSFSTYYELIKKYTNANETWSWIFVAIVLLVMLLIVVGFVYLVVLLIKKIVKITKSLRKQDRLLKEVSRLNLEVAFYHDQMEKHLKKDLKDIDPDKQEEEEDGEEHRFSKLLALDKKYENGNDEQLNSTFTLKELCDNFRNYAASRIHYYYDEEVIREFISALACVRLIILQGISGTGKTSLPYAFGKFLNGEEGSFIQAIQPSWRERSEMLGFFNEFTKKYKEPEFLRFLYECRYSNNVHIMVLDEMNIARVEYYFAEFLSTLEIPRREEWVVEIVAKVEKDDPKLIENGKFVLPGNVWFVGTANNDDSTFAISDKVYDRAIIIDIDKKFVPFEGIDTPPTGIDVNHLYKLFEIAKENNPISQDSLDKVAELDLYVIDHFRVAFGNRIMKQLTTFVPVYVEAGGRELDGIDFILVKKVFRKFATQSASFLKKEIPGFIDMLNSLFGANEFPQTRAFITNLMKNIS